MLQNVHCSSFVTSMKHREVWFADVVCFGSPYNTGKVHGLVLANKMSTPMQTWPQLLTGLVGTRWGPKSSMATMEQHRTMITCTILHIFGILQSMEEDTKMIQQLSSNWKQLPRFILVTSRRELMSYPHCIPLLSKLYHHFWHGFVTFSARNKNVEKKKAKLFRVGSV